MDGRLLLDGGRIGAWRSRTGGAGRVLALPLLGALLATGAAACTDSSSSDNSKALDGWAQQVCDGLRDPVAQSRAALDDTAQVKQTESAADLQKRLAGDLGELSTSNQQIADAMTKAGAPKISNGTGVQQDAINELHQASQGFKDVQQKLTALPTNDQGKFADGLKSIGDQAQQLAKLSNSAMTKVQTGDLGKAFARQPGCRAAADASGSPAPNAAPSGSGSPAASTGASPGAPSNGSPATSGSPAGSPSGSPSSGGSQSAGPSGSGSPSAGGSGSPSGSASPS